MYKHFIAAVVLLLAYSSNAVVTNDLRLAAAVTRGPGYEFGFSVVDVLGDGNCFLWAALHCLNRPSPIEGTPLTDEMIQSVKDLKLELCESIRVSG
jgi:hypothetical protein